MLNYSALVLALILTALGQVYYKMYFTYRQRRYLVLAIGFFVSVPILNYIALKGITIGIVYMSTAVAHLLVVGLSHYLLKETLTRDHFVAMTLIIFGVFLYAH